MNLTDYVEGRAPRCFSRFTGGDARVKTRVFETQIWKKKKEKQDSMNACQYSVSKKNFET